MIGDGGMLVHVSIRAKQSVVTGKRVQFHVCIYK